MPICDLCGEDAPVLREDEARGWELCAECFRLNMPAQPRPARPRVTMLDLYEAMGTVDGDRARENDHA